MSRQREAKQSKELIRAANIQRDLWYKYDTVVLRMQNSIYNFIHNYTEIAKKLTTHGTMYYARACIHA